MNRMIRLLSAVVIPVMMLSALVMPAAADSAMTALNDCSDPSQFIGQSGLIFGPSAASPDGKALEIEYEYGPQLSLKSNVPKDQRAADAEKQYFCFWIKTPYSECDSGIFLGLKEDNEESAIDMIWNGNEGGYKGNIITIDKSGSKSYIKAGRLLVLKPGFEGYVAIPMKTALARHPGWGNSGDGAFDYAKIDEIQIWFDGSHAAYDEKYAFDNFMLAADESAFVNMVKATGITVKDAAPATPTSSAENQTPTESQAPAANEEEPPSEPDDASSEVQSDTSDTAATVSNVSNTTGNDTQPSNSGSAGNTVIFLIIGAVVLVAAAVALLFIYKPKCIFKNKSAHADAAENTENNDTNP